MNGLIGHVEEVSWYELENGDVVSFHTATNDEGSITFYSDRLTFPSITAGRLGITYTLMLNASDSEVEAFLASHPEVVVRKTIRLA